MGKTKRRIRVIRKGGSTLSAASPANTSGPPTSGQTESTIRAANRNRVLTGEKAEQVQRILSRPAQEPTPAMRRTVETYKRLMDSSTTQQQRSSTPDISSE